MSADSVDCLQTVEKLRSHIFLGRVDKLALGQDNLLSPRIIDMERVKVEQGDVRVLLFLWVVQRDGRV